MSILDRIRSLFAGDGSQPSPHDDTAREPMGPFTPDQQTHVGDSPEVHDDVIPQDLPPGHPGRAEVERQAAAGDGAATGNQ